MESQAARARGQGDPEAFTQDRGRHSPRGPQAHRSPLDNSVEEVIAPENGNGNGKGTFWKVVGILSLGVLTWIGSQLLVIPTHGYRLDAHEVRIGEQERLHATQQDTLNKILAIVSDNQTARLEQSVRSTPPPRRAK